MSRTLFALAALATIALTGGVAGATPGQVIWLSGNNGPIAFAEASWETRTSTSITDAGVLAAQTHRDNPGTTGPEHGAATHVFFELRTMYLDAEGQPTGGVDVSGNANGDVPFTIDLTLTAASVNATVPVTSCTLDAAGNRISCSDGGTMDVSVNWTGQGDISRGSAYENHFLVPGGFVFIDRLSGTFRDADATSTIGGQTFDPASEQPFTDMGNNVQLTVLVCPHGC
jgi:hypothetical protein